MGYALPNNRTVPTSLDIYPEFPNHSSDFDVVCIEVDPDTHPIPVLNVPAQLNVIFPTPEYTREIMNDAVKSLTDTTPSNMFLQGQYVYLVKTDVGAIGLGTTRDTPQTKEMRVYTIDQSAILNSIFSKFSVNTTSPDRLYVSVPLLPKSTNQTSNMYFESDGMLRFSVIGDTVEDEGSSLPAHFAIDSGDQFAINNPQAYLNPIWSEATVSKSSLR